MPTFLRCGRCGLAGSPFSSLAPACTSASTDLRPVSTETTGRRRFFSSSRMVAYSMRAPGQTLLTRHSSHITLTKHEEDTDNQVQVNSIQSRGYWSLLPVDT